MKYMVRLLGRAIEMATQTSMLHVRIDDELKTQAAETLAKFGLTISDAVRILLTRVARADLFAILDYISDDNPAAAWRLKEEIDLRIAQLPRHPRLYKPGREVGTREIVVLPNYLVVYAETANTLKILRVLHAA
jgi:toxin ParE1/3/4